MAPTFVIKKKTLKDIPDEELYFVDKEPAKECAICMELIGEKDRTVLKCGHEFHASCMIENVVSSNNTCPLCRENVGKKPEGRPKFTSGLMRIFIQNEFNSIKFGPVLRGIIERAGEEKAWKNISLEDRALMSDDLVDMLAIFGIRLGKQVYRWIEEGEERLEVPEEMEQEPYSIPLSSYSDIGLDGAEEEKDNEEDSDDETDPDMPELEEIQEEDEEVEPINLTAIFDEVYEADEEETDEEEGEGEGEWEREFTRMEDFLNNFVENENRESWSQRILANEWLSDFNNFEQANIEDLMWPSGGSGVRPLFERHEAEQIMESIIRYCCYTGFENMD